MRQLVITADDFGLCEEVNQGVLKAAQEGIVTSASLMPNGRVAEAAYKASVRHPSLDVGLHLTLVGERPLAPPLRIPHLVDARGRLPETLPALFWALATRPGALEDAECEWRYQLDWARARGLRVSHLNTHQHAHQAPALWPRLVRLAQEYGIPWVRGLGGAWRDPSRRLARFRRWPLVIGGCAASRWNQRKPMLVRQARAVFGVAISGRLNARGLRRILSAVPEGVSEIVCHPGRSGEEARRIYPRWRYQWQEELEALTAAEPKMQLRKEGIILTRFCALSAPVFEGSAQEACQMGSAP